MKNSLLDLLDDLMIEYFYEPPEIVLRTVDVTIQAEPSGYYRIYGAGYSGTWEYSAEYVARMLDRKFVDGILEERGVIE